MEGTFNIKLQEKGNYTEAKLVLGNCLKFKTIIVFPPLWGLMGATPALSPDTHS